MFLRIQETNAANEKLRQEREAHRRLDPLEQAKAALQRRGYTVYAEHIAVRGSKYTVVGKLRLTDDEVIEYAAKVMRRRNGGY